MSCDTPLATSAPLEGHNDTNSTTTPATAPTDYNIETHNPIDRTRPSRISIPPSTAAVDGITQRFSGLVSGQESHPVSPSPTVVGIKTPGKSDKDTESTSGYFDASRSPSYGSLSGLALPHLALDAPHAAQMQMRSEDMDIHAACKMPSTGRYGEKQAHADSCEKGDTLDAPVPPAPSTSPCPPVPGFTELERAATYATLDAEGYVRMSKPRMVFLTFAMLMTYFLGTASSTAPTLLIPSIARDLGSSLLETQWVASAYTLAFGCGLLFSGRMADMYGRRRLYLIGLCIYLVCAVLTGAIKHRLAMCFFRAFAGLGLSIASPAGFGIVGVNIRHEPARTVVFASFGLGNPVGAAFGGLLGGVMTPIGKSGWQYLFYLLAGMCGLILILAWFVVPRDQALMPGVQNDRRIDWVGGFLVTAAICLFTFSLTESGIAKKGWAAPPLFILSLILFTLFFFWSRHLELNTSYPPIIKPSLFSRHRGRISATCACAFLSSLSIYGFVYSTTAFYQTYIGLSALGNAVKMLTCNVTGCLAAGAVMVLVPRFKTPHLLAAGAVASGISSLIYALRPDGVSYWAMEFPAQLLLPWVIDFAVGIGNILISNLVKQDEQSVGGALFQTCGQVGSALGICLSALVTSQVSIQQGSLLTGIRAAFWFGSATSFAVILVALLGFRGVGLAKDIAQSSK